MLVFLYLLYSESNLNAKESDGVYIQTQTIYGWNMKKFHLLGSWRVEEQSEKTMVILCKEKTVSWKIRRVALYEQEKQNLKSRKRDFKARAPNRQQFMEHFPQLQ